MRRPKILMVVVLAVGLLALAPNAPAVADGNESPGPGPGLPLSYPSVSVGWQHTCVIRPEGAVKCWGRNSEGQLGLGDNQARGDGPGELGDALPAVNLGTGRTATALATGAFNTCALLDNGQVKCWGSNHQGQLGLGNNTDRGGAGDPMGDTLPAVALGTGRTATAITMSPARSGRFEQVHACALLDNGKVKCWGTNSFGELGLGTGEWRGGTGDVLGNNLPAVNLGTGRTAIAISAGQNTTCAILDNGQVKCWGRGEHGRLGTGATDERGDGPNEMGDALPAVPLGAGRTATAITQGHGFACVLLDNQQIKCWGRNDMGQLGNGDDDERGGAGDTMGDTLPAVDLGVGRSGRGVSAGENHVCALLDSDQAKCWGRNDEGQLGAGNTARRGGTDDLMGDSLPLVELPVMQAITAGGDSTCARLWNEETRCWGAGDEGVLGLGDTEARGAVPDEMGDALPSVDLPPRNDDFATAQVLAAGQSGFVLGASANSTVEPGEPGHFYPSAAVSIWYRWTPTTGGRTRLTTDGSGFDTVLAVYTGTAVNALTLVDADDDDGEGFNSALTFTATAGTTYRIAIDGFDGDRGRTRLNWQQSLPCDGQPVSVDLTLGDVPTVGADVIRGTDGDDTIDGLAGADRICGAGGEDTLTGGAGTEVDRLFGDAGNDTLNGGDGADVLHGGGQHDTLNGGRDGDTLKGGDGTDRLFGQGGADRLNGQNGADTLNGGADRDTCNGGPQRDTATTCEVRTNIP